MRDARGVGALGDQHADRVHARGPQTVGVGQLRADLLGAAAERGQQPQAGQARQLAHVTVGLVAKC